MREASEGDPGASLAAHREARDPGVHPDLDHVRDHRLGECPNDASQMVSPTFICNICRTRYRTLRCHNNNFSVIYFFCESKYRI